MKTTATHTAQVVSAGVTYWVKLREAPKSWGLIEGSGRQIRWWKYDHAGKPEIDPVAGDGVTTRIYTLRTDTIRPLRDMEKEREPLLAEVEACELAEKIAAKKARRAGLDLDKAQTATIMAKDRLAEFNRASIAKRATL